VASADDDDVVFGSHELRASSVRIRKKTRRNGKNRESRGSETAGENGPGYEGAAHASQVCHSS
jgi:hypothetical protein